MAYHRYIIMLFHVFLMPVLFPAVGNAGNLVDTAFVATCSSVAMLLLPGPALFYGGWRAAGMSCPYRIRPGK
ncbi:hypothetical protein BGC31_00620 [Komagataeibacter xylinus]|nr:hypothetical protein H845_1587 [Komagataeibacter xylinus E25]RFP07373.1 hypothetical protein BGC31_00620 [Komagataeibacter xylinus]RFP07766.1 hypothetical protein BFX83_00580 [Komagataeibacter xylinus]